MEIMFTSTLLLGLAGFALGMVVMLAIRFGEWFWRRRRERQHSMR